MVRIFILLLISTAAQAQIRNVPVRVLDKNFTLRIEKKAEATDSTEVTYTLLDGEKMIATGPNRKLNKSDAKDLFDNKLNDDDAKRIINKQQKKAQNKRIN